MISGRLLNKLIENNIEFKIDYILNTSCTFRIGGRCMLAVFPRSEEQLILSIALLDEEGVRIHICGKGSNTLFAEGYLDLAVIFTVGVNNITFNGNIVSCGAGAGLVSLAAEACDNGLSGIEFASGIPGSIGGAMYMNAGAYGDTMGNIVVSSRAYDRDRKQVMILTEHNFGYRESIYKEKTNLVCLGAEIRLCKGNREDIRKRMRELSENRRAKQPLEYPSAGSYFKRPEGDFAGRLIEISGLKGTAIGDAKISEKHAGFIVNVGKASFDDVMKLEKITVERVYELTGVKLEREVEVVI